MIRPIVLLALISLTVLASSQSPTSETKSDPTVVIAELSPPSYLPIAREARVIGDVVVAVNIRTDGYVDTATVLSGPALLRQTALDSALKSKFKCDGCASFPVSSHIVYKFELGDTIGCGQAFSPSSESKPERPYPQVTHTADVVTIYDRPVGTCDMEIDHTRVRSARCLFLWKCAWR